jgi:hypothetical protein
VKRLLLNCDQVFEVLTRGPFPTGSACDEGVEQHLAACHECRRLAEALRPAVALLHESMTADLAADLPEYQGALPPPRRPAIAPPVRTARRRPARTRGHASFVLSGLRLVAASLLVASIGGLLYGVSMSPRSRWPVAQAGNSQQALAPLAASPFDPLRQPDEQGLLHLAAFHLPARCLPASHRPVSAEQAAELLAAMADGSLAALHCCTECHRAGLAPLGDGRLVATIQSSCQLCHRG